MKKLDIVSEPEYSSRRREARCVIRRCKTRAGGNGKYRCCYKHQRQLQKQNNPLRYWYDIFVGNARRRKIKCTVTIGEFKEFCEETDYLTLKGKGADNLSIDRKNPYKGYEKGNLQLLTLANNSRKKYIDMKIAFGYYPTEEELESMYQNSEKLIEEIKQGKHEEPSFDDVPF